MLYIFPSIIAWLTLVTSEKDGGQRAGTNTSILVARALVAECNRFTEEHTTPRSIYFDSIELPPSSVAEYLKRYDREINACILREWFMTKWHHHRIQRYTKCSDACFVSAIIYLFRVQTCIGIQITWFSVHRLIAVSTMIAQKFVDGDGVASNRHFATVFGVALPGMHIHGMLCIDMICIQYSRTFRVEHVGAIISDRHWFQIVGLIQALRGAAPIIDAFCWWTRALLIFVWKTKLYSMRTTKTRLWPTRLVMAILSRITNL